MLRLHWCARREALRFRRAMEEAQEKLGQATNDNSKLKAQLEAASSDLADIEAFANKRCVLGSVFGHVLLLLTRLVPISGSCQCTAHAASDSIPTHAAVLLCWPILMQ